jgi:TRAP-type mannitol/chloroaromatic compound transport system substrate-binding protein
VIDKSLGFQEIAKYYYFPGWHQPASWNSLIINMDVWDQYSEATQAKFMEACRANVTWSMGSAPGNQARVLEEFREQGIDVRRFPDPVLEKLREVSMEVLEEEAEKDEIFKEAYESLRAYMNSAGDWVRLQSLPRD